MPALKHVAGPSIRLSALGQRDMLLTVSTRQSYSQLGTLMIRGIVCFLLVPILLADLTAAQLHTVALSDQSPPGVPIGAQFQSFGSPVLNNLGDVAFNATMRDGLGGVTGATSSGIWSGNGNTLSLVARKGSIATGTNGKMWTALYPPLLNNAGQVAFRGELPFDSSVVERGAVTGIWATTPGSIRLAALAGTAAPGVPGGGRFTLLNEPVLNDSGQVAFHASLRPREFGVTDDNDTGIWSESASELKLLAREGSPAPAVSDAAVFGILTFGRLNDSGQISFGARLIGGVGGPGGLWRGSAGALELISRIGGQSPEGPGSVYTSLSGGSDINSSGRVVFSGRTSPDSREAIVTDASGVFKFVVRTNDDAPGGPVGAKFGSFLSSPAINDAGEIALLGALTPGVGGVTLSNNLGVWKGTGTDLLMVALKGDHAIGALPSDLFDAFNELTINQFGQIAFLADVRPNGDGVAKGGIWATDRSGALHLIAMQGGLLEIAPGDFRVISEISSGAAEGRGSGFNDLGQVAFRATFSDGTRGVFVSDIAAVPEPSSQLILVISIFTSVTAGRRARLPAKISI